MKNNHYVHYKNTDAKHDQHSLIKQFVKKYLNIIKFMKNGETY